jgi:hypothetical protein
MIIHPGHALINKQHGYRIELNEDLYASPGTYTLYERKKKLE